MRENYIIIEIIKKKHYSGEYPNFYFWRTYDQKEIDLILDIKGNLTAYEIKYGLKKIKIPSLWKKTYPESSCEIINPENYINFIT